MCLCLCVCVTSNQRLAKKIMSYFSKLGKLLHKTLSINSMGWNGGGGTKYEIDVEGVGEG